MKKTVLMLLLFALSISVLSSCNKTNTNNNNIPDSSCSINVSGAESLTVNFTMPGGNATDHVVNGSQNSNLQMLTLLATPLPITWMLSVVAEANTVKTGTFDLTAGMGSFINPDQTITYIAVSGILTITKATLYQDVSSIEDWYIDGNFSGTYQDTSIPPKQATISGSFSGVNIKAQ